MANECRKMQIKTIVRYHHIPTKVTKIIKTDNTNSVQQCAASGTLINCWWRCELVQPLRKIVTIC